MHLSLLWLIQYLKLLRNCLISLWNAVLTALKSTRIYLQQSERRPCKVTKSHWYSPNILCSRKRKKILRYNKQKHHSRHNIKTKYSDLFNGHFLSVTQNKIDFLQCQPRYEHSQRHIRVRSYTEPVILHSITYKTPTTCDLLIIYWEWLIQIERTVR